MVSILMPVYNESAYIEACLESILLQSYQNWELIAVDDFSTDDSYSKLQHYSKKDHRIKIFRSKSKGIIPALSLAFDIAKGTYITRMDGDDLMPHDKLETLVKTLAEAGKKSIATGFVRYFSESLELAEGFINYQEWLNKLCSHQNHFDEIYKECVVASPAWMAYKSDFELFNGFQGLQYPEDYDLVFKWYENNFKIISVEKVVHQWRDHEARSSRNDPNYMDQLFLDLKVPYFNRLDLDSSKTLYLWGAGKKGKQIASSLLHHDVPFQWVSGNKNKIGHCIYGKQIRNQELLSEPNKQVILGISDREFRAKKHDYYGQYKLKPSEVFEFV
jgi:glycosyltransferase involved in cell wall biosynthesis